MNTSAQIASEIALNTRCSKDTESHAALHPAAHCSLRGGAAASPARDATSATTRRRNNDGPQVREQQGQDGQDRGGQREKSSYIGKKIKVAVKAGGPDPDANRALGLIIKEAQALNVKRDIVDRNIKAASSDKDGADFKELTYELYGHGGVGFVINALSDNSNRAYTDVGTVAKKANLKLAESGSVLHNFEKKGRLAVNSALDEDDLIELALENDVDDVEAGEPDPEGMRSDGEDVKTVAWVAPTDLGAMQKALVDAGHDCTANLVHEPMMLVECGDEDLEKNASACGPARGGRRRRHGRAQHGPLSM